MSQVMNRDVAAANGKRRAAGKAGASIPVRIRTESKEKIDALLARVNKDRIGRKVKSDDLICFSIDLLTDAHLDQIGAKLLSNKERLEILYRKLAKTKRGLTREEFLGMLLDGSMNAGLGAAGAVAAPEADQQPA